MAIQIFGTKKNNDTKKAQRFFKERGIKFQFIDLNEVEMSWGEFDSITSSIGGLDAWIDENSKDVDGLAYVKYATDESKEAYIIDHPSVMKLPIVRSKKRAVLGHAPDVWKKWAEEEKKIRHEVPFFIGKIHQVRMAGSIRRIRKDTERKIAESQMVFRPIREKHRPPIKAPTKKMPTIKSTVRLVSLWTLPFVWW